MAHIHGGNIYRYEKIADFSANINFRGMPERVRSAAIRAIDASVHYPDPDCQALLSLLAGREQVEEEQLICGNGAAELMFSLAFALRPRKAVLAEPSFFEYEQALQAADCAICPVMLSESDGFQVTERFAEEISEDTDIVILGSPNNPTGQLVGTQTLHRILERCQRCGALLVMDESFFDFLDRSDRARTLECTEWIGTYRNLFVLKSFTKMYAMPGLRFGYGICADQALLARMRALMQPWNVSLPAQMAAAAAAEEQEFAAETARQTAENRSWMTGKLRALGYRVFDSCTNYVLFTGPGDLKEFCLERGFLIRDCSNFRGLEDGAGRERYFRICIRSREENEELLQVLAQRKG